MVRFKEVSPDSNLTLNVLIGILFILGFIFTIIPTLRNALGVYLFFIVVSFLVYRSVAYQGDLFGISKNNLVPSFFYGIIGGLIFYYSTKLIPGFSMGFPFLPQTIGSSMRFFIVVFVASWVETFFVQGALFGYLKSNMKTSYAIFIQAIFFALLHLGAFIAGFYQLPSFAVALTSFWANFATFFGAFLFALISGYAVSMDGIRNLTFVGMMHMTINFLIYASLVVVF